MSDECRRCPGSYEGRVCEPCAARAMGRTPQTIRRWTKSGRLPAIPGTEALLGYPLFDFRTLVLVERDVRQGWPEGTGPARTAAAARHLRVA